MNSGRRALSIGEVIDSQKSTSLQVTVGLICGGVAFCDSYGIQAVSYAGPSLQDLLGLDTGWLGLVFSVGLLGMMAGGLLVGPLSDRWGRRPPMIIATFAFGVLTAATVLVSKPWHLLALRCFAGLALGAALPNAFVLAAEFSPLHNRRLTIALLMAGYTVGGLVAGLLAAPLITHLGWQAIFVLGSVAAILTAALAWAFVPESMLILLRRPDARARAQLDKILRRVAPGTAVNRDALTSPEASASRVSLTVLFSNAYWKVTLTLWANAFTVMLSIYLFLSWTPVILRANGMPIGVAVLVTALFNVGTVISAIAVGWLMDRFSPAYVLIGFLIFGAAALCVMGIAPDDPDLLKAISCAIGLGLGGAVGGMNLLATTLYPGEARVTGSGWAISIGRLGSVIGPAIGAVWLSARGTSSAIYVALAPMLLIAAGLSMLLASDKKGASGGAAHAVGRQ